MDITALYLLTQVSAAINIGKKMQMPAHEVWRSCYIAQMKARESVDHPDNTLPVPEGTRIFVGALHETLFPQGDKITWEQRVMLIELFITEEIDKCVGGKYLWPHTYSAEQLKVFGFQATQVPGFYQIPYYLITHLSRDTLLFFTDGQWTTTIEKSEPLEGFSPDQSGMLPLGMYALGEMPEQHRHNFFMETE